MAAKRLSAVETAVDETAAASAAATAEATAAVAAAAEARMATVEAAAAEREAVAAAALEGLRATQGDAVRQLAAAVEAVHESAQRAGVELRSQLTSQREEAAAGYVLNRYTRIPVAQLHVQAYESRISTTS